MSESKIPAAYAKAVLTIEGAVQQYISLVTSIAETTLWPGGVTPQHVAASFQQKATGHVYDLRVEIVDRDWMLDTKCVDSALFRRELTNIVADVRRMFYVRVTSDTVPVEYRSMTLWPDPKNTTLAADTFREHPKRIGFTLTRRRP